MGNAFESDTIPYFEINPSIATNISSSGASFISIMSAISTKYSEIPSSILHLVEMRGILGNRVGGVGIIDGGVGGS